MRQFKDLVFFLKDYEKFFLEFQAEESQKLQGLTTWNLETIDKCNAQQQVFQKKMESMEEKREALQKDLGMDGYTFRQIIDAAPQEYRQEVAGMFERIQTAIQEVKYLNKKSMEIVHRNVKTIGAKLPEESSNPVVREYNSANKTTSEYRRIEIKI